ncbi:hypothetical protein TNCV_366731 [Trichonephila clavipes]|nr:hypothetical protein TNCV_366731 [Trichonephila clavipes]
MRYNRLHFEGRQRQKKEQFPEISLFIPSWESYDLRGGWMQFQNSPLGGIGPSRHNSVPPKILRTKAADAGVIPQHHHLDCTVSSSITILTAPHPPNNQEAPLQPATAAIRLRHPLPTHRHHHSNNS